MLDFPYMVDSTRTFHQPVRAQTHACPATPDGKRVMVMQPYCKLDVLRMIHRLKGQAETHCLLLTLPESGDNITRMDLFTWAQDAERIGGLPVHLLTPEKATFGCGAKACCHCHAETVEKEQKNQLNVLLGRSSSIAEAFDYAFKNLPHHHRQFVQNWAYREEPQRPGHPIRIETLAAAFQITKRQAYRILQQCQEMNPELFTKLKSLRTHRYRKTGAYHVE